MIYIFAILFFSILVGTTIAKRLNELYDGLYYPINIKDWHCEDNIMNEPFETDKNKILDYSVIVGKDTKKTLRDKRFVICRTIFDTLYLIKKDGYEAIACFDENDILIHVDKEWWESKSDAGKLAFLLRDK